MTDRQKHPTYVMHDDVRWHVDAEITIDDKPAYELSHRYPTTGRVVSLVAMVSDCAPWVKTPNVRRLKDENFVLEFDGRTMTIRKRRSPTRFAVSLQGVYHGAAKAHAMTVRLAKLKAKGKRLPRGSKR